MATKVEIKPMNSSNYSEMEREDRGRRPVKLKREDDPDRCHKYTTTFVIYYCNFTLGIVANFLGPTLLDFRDSLGTDTPTIALVFTVIMATMLVSSMFFGVLYNYVNRHALVVFLLFLMAGSITVLPHSGTLTTFFLLAGIMALASGGWVTAQTVWVIEIWKDAAGPFIQGQHFAYAIGAMFPPLIFGPFLSHDSPVDTLANSTEIPDVTESDGVVVVNEAEMHSLAVPCAISGVIIAIGAILQLVILLALKAPSEKNAARPDDDEKNGGTKLLTNGSERQVDGVPQTVGQGESSPLRNIILIILSAFMVGAWQSMEASAGQFLAPFSHFAEVNLSEADGATVFFYYTVAFTIGRAVGIFAILKISPQLILCGNFLLAVSGNLLLLTYGVSNVEHLWIGAMLLGLGYSCSIPSVFAYVKSHIQITNFVGAFLMAFGGTLAATYPILVGNFIEKLPTVLMFVNFGSIMLGSVAFVAIFCLTQRKC